MKAESPADTTAHRRLFECTAAAIVGLAVAGCLGVGDTQCADGSLCPYDRVCVLDRCVDPAQISACVGLDEGMTCAFGGIDSRCRGGACLAIGCGDGDVTGSEDCDGTNLGDRTCADVDFYTGTLACNTDCTFDTRGCEGTCGDGVLDPTQGESCDGTALGTFDCSDFGFYAPEGLACNLVCGFNSSGCSGGRCGDGLVNGSEVCDGGPPVASSCITVGRDAGFLSCDGSCEPDTSHCGLFGWRSDFVNVLPLPYFRNVWGTGDRFFAVHHEGVLVSSNGGWSPLSGVPNGGGTLQAIWGSSVQDIWVAGVFGIVAHYNGVTWTTISAPAGDYYGAWGSASNDVYFVGSVISHWNGTAVTAFPLPPSSPVLRDAWGSGTGELFVVGAGGYVARYTTAGWEQMASDTVEDLYAVWGRSANEVYAVGSNGATIHFDGESWSAMAGCGALALWGLWGASNGPMIAIGADTAICELTAGTWHRIPQPGGLPLRGVFGGITSNVTSTIYVVGDRTVLRGSGAARTTNALPAGMSSLGIGGSSPNDYFVVGREDSGGPAQIKRFLDGLWTTYSFPSLEWVLDVTSGPLPNRAVASGPGNVLRFDGSSWTPESTPTSEVLLGLWQATPTDIHAVGGNGTILHRDASSWSAVASPTTDTLVDVWGASPTAVYAIGQLGTILKFNGVSWSTMDTPTLGGPHLKQVWGRSANDVFVVGEQGVVAHYDGVTWKHMYTGFGQVFLQAVWGDADTTYASGEGITIMLTGGRWTRLDMGEPAAPFHAFVAWGVEDFVVFGGADSLNRRTIEVVGDVFACAASEVSCRDGWDDDCDGAIDCADTSCATDPTCLAGGVCQSATPLECGVNVTGTTIGGAMNLVSSPCNARDESGREAYYRITMPATGSAFLQLMASTGDLDLMVVGSASSGACLSEGPCLASSQTAGSYENVLLPEAPGAEYFVIVDGNQGATSTFTLKMTCL